MALPGFYNENMGRSYPFIHNEASAALKPYAVCDFGCYMGVGSGFVEGVHSVYLTDIRKIGNKFVFIFGTDAPGLVDKSLVFYRELDAALYVTDYATASHGLALDGGVSSSMSYCHGDTPWLGYLVTGDIHRLLRERVSDFTANVPVEPSQIEDHEGTYTRRFSVANADRTRAAPADDCRDYCWPFDVQDHYIACACLIEPILFREGYNCYIQLDAHASTITVGASLGGGTGEPCELVKVTADEGPPPIRKLLDGALGCNEIVRTINGVGRRYFHVSGGHGVIVTPVPAENKLVVDVSLLDMAVCVGDLEQSSLTLPNTNSDPCSCGPKAIT